MSRSRSTLVFDLIRSLDKNEKRYFKLMASSSGNMEDKKVLQLFDLINKQKTYDEDELLSKAPDLKKSQLSNMKAYLHEKILQSLRAYHLARIPDIQIREQIDFAQLLLERRQFGLASGCLRKAKKLATLYDNLELQLEVLRLEKEVLLHTTELKDKSEEMITQVREINSRISNVNTFSNLTVKLNTFYRKIGFIRNEQDFLKVQEYVGQNLPAYDEEHLSTKEKIHLYHLLTGYYFFIQDFENGHVYARKLEHVFQDSVFLKKSNAELYVTALNTLLTAEFKLNRYKDFVETSKKLEEARTLLADTLNENLRIRLIKYFFIHEINRYFLLGDFDNGIRSVNGSLDELENLLQTIDLHSAMILNYKIACLYFGGGNYNQCIRWLNRIINLHQADIREDLHCFARILNLICHYELGNMDVIRYYIISTYRFLLKKDDLHLFQKYILTFLKELSEPISDKAMKARFGKLKVQLVPLQHSRFEKRAFIYFDIISWLESKIEQRPVQAVIKDKSLALHQ